MILFLWCAFIFLKHFTLKLTPKKLNCIELLLTKNCRRGDCRRYKDTGDSESRGAARGLPAGSTFAVCATLASKNDQRNGRESFDGFVCSGSRVGTSIWLVHGLMLQCFR